VLALDRQEVHLNIREVSRPVFFQVRTDAERLDPERSDINAVDCLARNSACETTYTAI